MATSLFEQENTEFIVLQNHENQYSLWPKWKSIPGGWKSVGIEGNKQQCIDYIDREWTDMRPKSLTEFMQG